MIKHIGQTTPMEIYRVNIHYSFMHKQSTYYVYLDVPIYYNSLFFRCRLYWFLYNTICKKVTVCFLFIKFSIKCIACRVRVFLIPSLFFRSRINYMHQMISMQRINIQILLFLQITTPENIFTFSVSYPHYDNNYNDNEMVTTINKLRI